MRLDWLTTVPISTEGWPQELAAIAPGVWRAVVIFGALLLAWIVSWLAKAVVRLAARSLHKDKSTFEGSLGDILAPVVQLATFLAIITAGLDVLGLPIGAQLATAWPAAVSVILIFVSAYFIARWASRAINRFGQRAQQLSHADITLFGFFASILKYAIFIIAAVVALDRVGFDTNTLVALVGAAGLAIGLALQDTLKAVASGLMLAIFRPFRVGDWVSFGENEGEVVAITPFQTTLKTVDNRAVILPNTVAWSEPATNFSRFARRRLDLYFDIDYDDDIDHALSVISGVARDHPRVLAKDDIWTGVHAFATSSIVTRLRAWVANSEFIEVRADIYRAIKYAFDREGITIPYPHQTETFKEPPPALRVRHGETAGEDDT